MKIIQICASYKPAYVYGGPTMSVSKLCEELRKSGVELEVLTTTANGKTELDVTPNEAQLVDGVKVRYFKRWTKDHTHFSPMLYWHLHRLIRKEEKKGKKDELIIHIHAWWNLVSIFSCWIAKLHGIKVVLSPRGMLNKYTLNNRNAVSKKWLHQLIGKRLLRYCHILTTSIKEKEEIKNLLDVRSIVVIPNFVFFPKNFNLITTNASSVYRLLFLSRIEEKKGLEILLEALSKTKLQFHLEIAGSGETNYVESLKNLAKELRITTQISWLGLIDTSKKFELLAQHDLMILSSHNENFANVVIESLSVGTPVLISKNVGLADYVLENNLGWVCENTPDELAKTIAQSFYEIEKRKTIEETAPTIIRNDFEEKYLVEKYLDLYNNLITRYVRI